MDPTIQFTILETLIAAPVAAFMGYSYGATLASIRMSFGAISNVSNAIRSVISSPFLSDSHKAQLSYALMIQGINEVGFLLQSNGHLAARLSIFLIIGGAIDTAKYSIEQTYLAFTDSASSDLGFVVTVGATVAATVGAGIIGATQLASAPGGIVGAGHILAGTLTGLWQI